MHCASLLMIFKIEEDFNARTQLLSLSLFCALSWNSKYSLSTTDSATRAGRWQRRGMRNWKLFKQFGMFRFFRVSCSVVLSPLPPLHTRMIFFGYSFSGYLHRTHLAELLRVPCMVVRGWDVKAESTRAQDQIEKETKHSKMQVIIIFASLM